MSRPMCLWKAKSKISFEKKFFFSCLIYMETMVHTALASFADSHLRIVHCWQQVVVHDFEILKFWKNLGRLVYAIALECVFFPRQFILSNIAYQVIWQWTQYKFSFLIVRCDSFDTQINTITDSLETIESEKNLTIEDLRYFQYIRFNFMYNGLAFKAQIHYIISMR